MPAKRKHLFLALAFVALTLALLIPALAEAGNGVLVIAYLTVGGLIFGILIGEWWAMLLAFSWLPVALINPDEEAGVAGTIYLVLLISIPLNALFIAGGVAIRRTWDLR